MKDKVFLRNVRGPYRLYPLTPRSRRGRRKSSGVVIGVDVPHLYILKPDRRKADGTSVSVSHLAFLWEYVDDLVDMLNFLLEDPICASYYVQGNVVETEISSQGDFVKAAGATVEGPNVWKFVVGNNRVTYVGTRQKVFRVSVIVSFSGANNTLYSCRLALNGQPIEGTTSKATTTQAGRVQNVSVQGLVSLEENDYLELWIANMDGSDNVTVEELNLVVGL